MTDPTHPRQQVAVDATSGSIVSNVVYLAGRA
jgi:hypothetical protein